MLLTRRSLLLAGLLGPVLPALAAAAPGPVHAVVHSAALPVGDSTVTLVGDEQLVGVTWPLRAPAPSVRLRWLTAAGWTSWERPEQDESTRATRAGTEPVWRPRGATRVELDVRGAAHDLRLVRVADGPAPRSRTAVAHAAERHPLLGVVHRRADWGADESRRNGAPSYASTVSAVVVHHTAGSNDYAQADVPRRIRADYAYHVDARGWDDLGYNLVVDAFGGIWEGRAGGLGRATIGSHAAGFNTATLGVSLLGDMTRALPSPEAVRAFARVAAYAAATWRFDPRGTVTLTSRGGPRYASGTRVTLPRVLGHTDVGRTACPGALMDRLEEVRRTAAALLGPAPRVLGVDVSGAPVSAPRPLVITGRLDRSAPWTAALRDDTGAIVTRAAGESATPRLEWDGLRPLPLTSTSGAAAGLPALLPAAPGRYTWAVAVDDGVHARARREGVVEVGLPLVG